MKLHFLRPEAFWLLLPLAVVAGMVVLVNRDRRKWRSIVAPHLRPWLFTRSHRWSFLLPLTGFVIATVIGVMALAGPAWKKKPFPAEKIRTTLLVVLDVSQSMLATDLLPTRLERAKFKLTDLIDADPRAPMGLLAFAGTAHPVLPFTSDYSLIRHHAASLQPRVMPVPGTDIAGLLTAIDSLMKNCKAPGTILLMTDALDAGGAELLAAYIHTVPHQLEILLFSTPGGAAVPGHPSAESRQDPGVIQALARDSAIHVTPLTLDNSDVGAIATRIRTRLLFQKDDAEKEAEWEDEGRLFLLPVLMLTLVWFRKGWVIQWCWLPVAALGFCSCGAGSRHPDWWYSKDYQGQLLADKGKWAAAADRFDDDEHKAVAFYKAGNYEAAADLFSLVGNAAADYNRGLALIKLGRTEEAMAAFDSAAAHDPVLGKKVAAAKAAIQAMDSRKVGAIKKMPPAGKKDKKDSLKERPPESDDEQLSSDTRVGKLPTSGNRVTDEVKSNIHGGKEAKTPPKDQKPEKPRDGANEIILRQSAADESEFLHRRFELQAKRYHYNMEQKFQKQPW